MFKLMAAILILSGCTAIKAPADFKQVEITTRNFNLAVWQKITDPDGVYKIYIEGDGHAFNARAALQTIQPRAAGCYGKLLSATKARMSYIWRVPANMSKARSAHSDTGRQPGSLRKLSMPNTRR